MFKSEEIKTRILAAYPDALVKVTDLTGGQDHYQVEVISSAFAGVSAIQRHRKIYALFSDVVGGALHALSLQLKTPEE